MRIGKWTTEGKAKAANSNGCKLQVTETQVGVIDRECVGILVRVDCSESQARFAAVN
ncbi:MAG: hypothetical protein LBN30_04210 [Oscillospiraceae bacterium]|nr:hypothetical protein [Oscillospiraceae bacterium]